MRFISFNWRTAACLHFIALACTQASLSAVQAAAIDIQPTLLKLPNARPISSLIIRNKSDTPTSLEAAGYSWTQEGGKDVLTHATEFVVTPPIFTIPPNSEQVLRVGLFPNQSSSSEKAYRLLVREIPDTSNHLATDSGIKVLLEMSIPVFKKPVGNAEPKLSINTRRRDDGYFNISIVNTGNSHARVQAMRLINAQGKEIRHLPMLRYVLPNREQFLETISAPHHSRTGTIQIEYTSVESTTIQTTDFLISGR